MIPQDARIPAEPVRLPAAQEDTPAPYFREVKVTFVEGEFSVDPSCTREMEQAKSDAITFWVGGGSLYMH